MLMRHNARTDNNISFGKRGETIAVKYLKRLGYHIVDQNYRAKSLGEIDIVATKDNRLIFIEVKIRRNTRFGNPVEAVTPTKLRRIERVGWAYKEKHPSTPKAMSIEVLSIIEHPGEKPKIKLFKIY